MTLRLCTQPRPHHDSNPHLDPHPYQASTAEKGEERRQQLEQMVRTAASATATMVHTSHPVLTLTLTLTLSFSLTVKPSYPSSLVLSPGTQPAGRRGAST